MPILVVVAIIVALMYFDIDSADVQQVDFSWLENALRAGWIQNYIIDPLQNIYTFLVNTFIAPFQDLLQNAVQ